MGGAALLSFFFMMFSCFISENSGFEDDPRMEVLRFVSVNNIPVNMKESKLQDSFKIA